MHPTVFISYSHQDTRWKESLVRQLAVLEREGLLKTWHDGLIQPGTDWLPAIEAAMARAKVAVLIVSANFLTSVFVRSQEIPTLLARRQQEGLWVIPLLARPCPWQRVPWLAVIQARPLDGKTLAGLGGVKAEEVLARLAEDILKLLEPQAGSSPGVPVAPSARKLPATPAAPLFAREARASAGRSAKATGDSPVPQPAGHFASSLADLERTAEETLSSDEQIQAIKEIGRQGGQSALPWLKAFILRSKQRLVRRAAIRQIVARGGSGAVAALRDIAEKHKSDWVKIEALELIPTLDGLANPEWYRNYLIDTEKYSLRYRLLQAIAKEAWCGRLDLNSEPVRETVTALRDLADTERHPDVRHHLVSIVAHLRGDEEWVRDWVLDKARQTESPYYRIRGYAIGLSVWNGDATFMEALAHCADDRTGLNGRMFLSWASSGEWSRYRFHMGGWGPCED